MKTRLAGLAMVVVTISMVGCKDDPIINDWPTPKVSTPETYSFQNVSFSGQTERLNQLDEIIEYAESANAEGTVLDSQVFMDMYANTGENGGGNFSFSSTKDLKSKTFELSVTQFEDYFEKLAEISASTEIAQNGVAGRISNEDNTKSRLFDENGKEYAELIEKGIMGAVFYYQATSVYLSDGKMDVDNSIIVEGEGTAMQHHWDEAYGYFGATVNFPTDQESVRYWAKYAVSRDATLNSISELGSALRTGRAAIDANEIELRDIAIGQTRAAWEKLCAGSAIHYLNSSIENIGDDYSRNHSLSEALAFIENLVFNESRTISISEIENVKMLIGDNFYEVNLSGLQAARNELALIFGLEEIRAIL